MSTFYAILLMLGGLAVFLYGMKMMSDSLESVAGNKMKAMFAKVSNNRFKGVAVGMGVTAIIQSSSATTVMLVGFVNVGMITLVQATSMIMGANIGTTITAQLQSLSGLDFNVTAVMSLVACVGAFLIMFAKGRSKGKMVKIGEILIGLGMLFIGLSIMSTSMKSLAEVDGVPTAFANFMMSFKNPFLALLCGAIFTAVIQSSSAATGILLSFAASSIVSPTTAIFMILGMNIGTCVTALISSIGANVNAKRTAFIHLLFNVLTTIIFFVPMLCWGNEITNAVYFISGFGSLSDTSALALQRVIANFHTIFNVIGVLLLLPFIKPMVKLAEKVVRDKKGEAIGQPYLRMFFFDERFLKTPPLAIAQIKKEIVNMADLAHKNLQGSIEMLLSRNFDKEAELRQREELLNYLNRTITKTLIKISTEEITENDEKQIGSYYHVVSDIERIGDYAENFINFANKMTELNCDFSADAKMDIMNVRDKLNKQYYDVITAFQTRSLKILPVIDKQEQELDDYKRSMSDSHIERLKQGECTAEVGAVYLSLASQFERVADHMTNIAYSIRERKEDSVKQNVDVDILKDTK